MKIFLKIQKEIGINKFGLIYLFAFRLEK